MVNIFNIYFLFPVARIAMSDNIFTIVLNNNFNFSLQVLPLFKILVFC